MNKNNNLGFTLIELMIVVAIIGILASIAIPAYQNYVAKSVVTTIYASASGGRTAMMSRYMEIGEMPEEGNGANGIIEPKSVSIGLDSALRISDYQSSVSYKKESAKKGVYQVTLDNINSNLNGKTVSFVFEDDDGTLSMSCIPSPSIAKKYLPKSCQL